MKRSTVSFALLIFTAAAQAATVEVQVRTANGAPVADAVVMIDSPRAPAGPIHFPWAYVIAQETIAFNPHVLIVPVGTTVAFPNRDQVRHHVYSFSPAKRFELRLYGRQQERTVTFDKPGPVALGCNIHDRMIGFIMVVATPYAAKTDANGRAVIGDVPGGLATLTVWHPLERTRDNQIVSTLSLPASGTLARTVALDLR
jgi:plastocyanin